MSQKRGSYRAGRGPGFRSTFPIQAPNPSPETRDIQGTEAVLGKARGLSTRERSCPGKAAPGTPHFRLRGPTPHPPLTQVPKAAAAHRSFPIPVFILALAVSRPSAQRLPSDPLAHTAPRGFSGLEAFLRGKEMEGTAQPLVKPFPASRVRGWACTGSDRQRWPGMSPPTTVGACSNSSPYQPKGCRRRTSVQSA